MRRRLSFMIILIISVFHYRGFAIETNQNVTIRIPNEEIRFLDTFEMTVTANDYYKIISISTNYNFTYTSVSIAVTALESNMITLSVKSYEISNFTFPALKITAMKVTNDLVVQDTFYTPEVEIENALTNSSGNLMAIEDIIDIKDYSWIWITLSIICGAGFIVLILILILKRTGKIKPASEPEIDPFDEVERDLNYLRDEYEVLEENYKEFYAKISEIDRRFMERIFDINALEMSTSEINSELKNLTYRDRTLPEEMKEIIIYIMKLCDRVKYAKHKPPLNQTTTVLEESYELVKKTRELIDSIEVEMKEQRGNNHEIS